MMTSLITEALTQLAQMESKEVLTNRDQERMATVSIILKRNSVAWAKFEETTKAFSNLLIESKSNDKTDQLQYQTFPHTQI